MNYKKIADLVGEILGVQLSAKTRRRAHAEARAIYYELCRTNYGASFYEVSSVVGRDHSTAVHGVKMFNNLYGVDKGFTDKANMVREIITNAAIANDNDSSEKDELLLENKILKIRINELTLRAESLEREFDSMSRIASMVDRLKQKIPQGKELEAEKQLNRFLNGIRF